MKKRVLILSLTLLLSSVVGCSTNDTKKNTSSENKVVTNQEYTVRFLDNIPTTEVSLGSGATAVGNNLVFKSVTVKENEVVSKPSEDPTRKDYLFDGWYQDKDCKVVFDFTKTITSNTNIYAKWIRDPGSEEEVYVEPNLKFEEVVDSSVTGLELNGVLNSPIKDGSVKLTTIGVRKLQEKSIDCKELLNYRKNPNTEITSAKYVDNKVKVEYKQGEETKSIEVSVANITSTIAVANSYYETKAVKYETNSDVKPYSIVLGGSSSMENWSTSEKDMSPLTTVNVGIGGTTAEQWRDSLAQRLIYPFSPREVVLYVGINNVINSKESKEEVGAALVGLFDDIHAHLPNTTIFYVLMNLIPNYMTYKDVIEGGNAIALDYGKDKSYMQYIDAGKLLLKDDGLPNSSYFLTDGLHMSQYGYVLWGGKVKESVIEFEKGYYGNKA